MWQYRISCAVKLLAGASTRQHLHGLPCVVVVTQVSGCGSACRNLHIIGRCAQRRSYATRPDDQLEASVGTGVDGVDASSSTDIANGTSKETAMTTPPKKVESIEDILVRTHRKELVQRVGPHVERYLPTEDPNAFLLPDNRLEPDERRWQKFFVALPWAVFACMLATPLLLVGTNLPWLQERAEFFRRAQQSREDEQIPSHLPGFQVVNFGQMPDVLERPFPTMLMILHPSAFASKIFLPVLHDLADLLRNAGIVVSVAALDVSLSPQPPQEFLWEYPPALAPHLQLVLPRVQDGEAGVVDYDGRWNVIALAEVARRLAGPYAPAVPAEDLERLEAQLERFRDLLFELVFLGGSIESADVSNKRAAKSSWVGRFFGSGSRKALDTPEGDSKELEQQVDFSGSVANAVRSCEIALRAVQSASE